MGELYRSINLIVRVITTECRGVFIYTSCNISELVRPENGNESLGQKSLWYVTKGALAIE